MNYETYAQKDRESEYPGRETSEPHGDEQSPFQDRRRPFAPVVETVILEILTVFIGLVENCESINIQKKCAVKRTFCI